MIRHLLIGGLCALVLATAIHGPAHAQPRKPTAKEIVALQDCVKQKSQTSDGAEGCIYKLVAEPCIEAEGGSTHGMAECLLVEESIWDSMLNAFYKDLQEDLDSSQKAKLREMQRAWIASRDRTCEFYHDRIQGSMAVSESASCMLRETARRALLLQQLIAL